MATRAARKSNPVPRLTQITLTVADLPFRPARATDGPNRFGQTWFDRDVHIHRYAVMLDALRKDVGEDHWRALSTDDWSSVPLAAELKRTISDLVQKCSESTDFFTTVDFITTNAMKEVEKLVLASARQKPLKGHLGDRSAVSHEHMCPTNQIFLYLTSGTYPEYDTEALLRLLSFRALVSGTKTKNNAEDPEVARAARAGTDLYKLEREDKSTVPDPLKMAVFGDKSVPLKFYPLLRYHKAGLLDALMPVSVRGEDLLNAYLDFIA